MAKPPNSISICEWIDRHQPVNCFVAPPAHNPDPGLAIPRLSARPLQQHARTFGADAAKRAGKGRIVVAGVPPD